MFGRPRVVRDRQDQEIYQQLSKELRGDVEEIKRAHIKAYGMVSFVAFDHFPRRQVRPGKPWTDS